MHTRRKLVTAKESKVASAERKQNCLWHETECIYHISVCASCSYHERGFANFLAVRDIFFLLYLRRDGNTCRPGQISIVHLYAVAFSSEREQWTISSAERPSVDVMFTVDVTTPRHEFCVPFMKSPTSEWRNTKHLPSCKAHVEYFIRLFSIFTVIRNPLLFLCTQIYTFLHSY